jgi:outer membrane receptor protein involved in Fe transport
MIATGKSSSDRSVYDAGYVGEELPLKENYLDWDERNSITLSMDIRYFRGDEFNVFGLSLPSNWGLNLLWKYGSGLPYTLKDEENNNIEGENVANNARKPYTSTFDIKLNKGIAFGGIDFDLILDVRNVFDRENIREVDGRWGTPYGDGRLYLRDPYNYHPGRNVRVGVKASF